MGDYVSASLLKLHEHGNYIKGEKLLDLVDISLNGDFNNEETSRHLKIALLRTQDIPNLRPTMSTVVKMLKGEEDINNMEISKPGLLAELMGHIHDKGHKKILDEKHTSQAISADSGELHDSSSLSKGMTTSYVTMTFSSVYDWSN